MKNIEEILKSLGIQVPEDKATELTRLVAENYKTTNEHEKRVKAIEGERDGFKEKYETAQNTLSGFEKMDIEGIKKELGEYKTKVENMEKEHQKALYERDFSDELKRNIEGIKFSSEAAKKTVMTEAKAAGLALVDGKIMGFNDFISNYKEKDATAFIDEQTEDLQKNKASFTRPMQNNNDTSTKTNMAEQIRTAMGLKTEKGEL